MAFIFHMTLISITYIFHLRITNCGVRSSCLRAYGFCNYQTNWIWKPPSCPWGSQASEFDNDNNGCERCSSKLLCCQQGSSIGTTNLPCTSSASFPPYFSKRPPFSAPTCWWCISSALHPGMGWWLWLVHLCASSSISATPTAAPSDVCPTRWPEGHEHRGWGLPSCCCSSSCKTP